MRCWCCCCLMLQLQHFCCSHGFRHVLCPCFPFSLRIRTRRRNTLHVFACCADMPPLRQPDSLLHHDWTPHCDTGL
ncbi:hypothetical protein COO60DRAFT_1490088, partial [Scenedesmus sp. NREL 46B-D3]